MDIASLFADPDHIRAILTAVLPKLFLALVVLLAFWLVLRWSRPLLRKALHRAGFHEALTHMLIEGIFKSSIVVIALIAAAAQLGINVAAALAGLGVVGIAVGFAAQETVANMIAGFLVFWDRPFKIGDFITTQSQYGKVQEITMRTTRIRTMENTFVVIPNKQIIGDLLINHSMYGELRVNVPLGIAYKEKVAAAREVLMPVLLAVPGVLGNPAPRLVATGLGDSSVNLSARVWISDASLEMDTTVAVVEACKLALDNAGIEIPFPHLQVFLEDVKEPAQRGLAGIPKLVK
jgi:small-conductance mechanosensitive channel